MYQKTINVLGQFYTLSSDSPITPEIEQMQIKKLSASCPSTPKTVGSNVLLKCTATVGTAPFTITFKKNGTQLTQFTNVPLNSERTLNDTVSSVGSVTYSAECVDSCANPSPLTTTETCTVNVIAACVAPQITFTLT